MCDERKDCPQNESGDGGEDEEDCDHQEGITHHKYRGTQFEVDQTLAGSAPPEVLPELDWCKSNASKSLNTRSGPDAVHSGPDNVDSGPASSVIGPG